jgi:hypothetical protein
MDNQPTTAEAPVSKAKEEIIKEAKRIEEDLLHSAKKHFVASDLWSVFHLVVGIPMVIISAIAGASALAQFDKNHVVAGILSIVVAALSGIVTFLNPNAKSAQHLAAGNQYDSLMNRARIFWSIDCWGSDSDEVLTNRLKQFSEQKDKLNQSCPQLIPFLPYRIAKRGIDAGEAEHKVDKAVAK